MIRPLQRKHRTPKPRPPEWCPRCGYCRHCGQTKPIAYVSTPSVWTATSNVSIGDKEKKW